MKDMISVIIPVYNVEKYLRKCLDSLLNQSYKRFEVILVDDGSTDDSGQICEEYAKGDNRIRVFHVKNGGTGRARNIGLKNMNGNYVTFVDSDDFVDEKYLEVLYNNIKKYKVLACFVGTKIVDDKKIISRTRKGTARVYDKKEMFKEFIEQKILNYGVCAALFNRHIFDRIIFAENKFSEDMWIKFELMTHLKKIVIDETEMYYYVIHKGSKMTSDFRLEKLDRLDVYHRQVSYTKQRYPELYGKVREHYFVYVFEMAGDMAATGKYDSSKEQKELLSKVRCQFFLIFKSRHLVWKAKILLIALCIHPRAYRWIIKLKNK